MSVDLRLGMPIAANLMLTAVGRDDDPLTASGEAIPTATIVVLVAWTAAGATAAAVAWREVLQR